MLGGFLGILLRSVKVQVMQHCLSGTLRVVGPTLEAGLAPILKTFPLHQGLIAHMSLYIFKLSIIFAFGQKSS